ncbi:MAG: hypothetical protein KC431_20885, partial [Myxococcales bacterium]|nr:hypothetical protein [Myxococcales bacterium]
MNDKRELAKLGLAFAVGVSLSAGYVAVGMQASGPDVVVVQERCPDGEMRWVAEDGGEVALVDKDKPRMVFISEDELSLAPLPGEEPVPEGLSFRVGMGGMWSDGDQGEPMLRLEGGRVAAADMQGRQIKALEDLVVAGKVTAVLWIDHRVPGATLRDLIYSLNRAGVSDYALVVAGEGQPRAYRFAPNRFGDYVEVEDGQWERGLSLRLTSAGTEAWIRPHIDGGPRLGAPDPLPLDLGERAVGAPCLLGAGLPDAQALAALESSLCEGRPLGVEFMFAEDRSVGELLALRALDARPGACRGPSFLAAAED